MTNTIEQTQKAVSAAYLAGQQQAPAPAPGLFLPAPRVPKVAQYPTSAAVAGVAGEEHAAPLADLETVLAAAERAVHELQASRPPSVGGTGARWTAALEADATDWLAGSRPKAWKVQSLVLTDVHRWAEATAACRAVPAAVRQCEEQLNRPEIARAAQTVTDARAQEWAELAQELWESTSDRGKAWALHDRGEELLGHYQLANEVWHWASGTPEPEIDTRFPPMVDHLPPDETARGFWLCAELALERGTKWLRLPSGVQFPPGSEELYTRAIGEDTKAFTALRQTGYIERKI